MVVIPRMMMMMMMTSLRFSSCRATVWVIHPLFAPFPVSSTVGRMIARAMRAVLMLFQLRKMM